MKDNMPKEIWASPRGSGTMSGVYVDMPMHDEPETKYIHADLLSEAVEVIKFMQEDLDLRAVDGVVPVSHSAYIGLETFLQKIEKEED